MRFSLKPLLAFATVLGLAVALIAPALAAGDRGAGNARGFSPLLSVQQGMSRPLRELPPAATAAGRSPRQLTVKHPGHGGGSGNTDSAVQSSATVPLGATVTESFQGVGVTNSIPPDPNGSAGATEFVETVNSRMTVFSKSYPNSPILGPIAINSLWSAYAAPCAGTDVSDPVVLYDKQAGQWVLMQLASVSAAPYYVCVAVSATSDAAGAWYLYAYNFGNSLPDYPKLGVWPDGYYFAVNDFYLGASFQGAAACVLPRSTMLTGGSGNGQCYYNSASVASLLPADLDGDVPGVSSTTGPPPAGTPGMFMNFGTNSLNLFQYHVDWGNLNNSTWTGPISKAVPSFSQACGGGTCVPQAGTSQQLASLGDRLMFRLSYRNFLGSNGYQSMVVNQSTVGSGTAAVRWYELRNPTSTGFTVYQASSYAPDSTYRWMGSVAQDRLADIAAGYSASSSSISPQIRYTARAVNDPLNTLRAEATVPITTASQTNYNRWGDYTSMSVDPTDDCTFWYTNEYQRTTGYYWSTWVTAFKMPGC
jgi:hypothetical protein